MWILSDEHIDLRSEFLFLRVVFRQGASKINVGKVSLLFLLSRVQTFHKMLQNHPRGSFTQSVIFADTSENWLGPLPTPTDGTNGLLWLVAYISQTGYQCFPARFCHPTVAGYPRHRENRENGQKKFLSGKTQGIWKFCQTTGKTQESWFAQVVNYLILKVKDIWNLPWKSPFFEAW